MKTFELEPGVWTEISDETCKYQNISNGTIYTYEGSEAPEDTNNVFIATPNDMLAFTSSGNSKLYALSPYNTARITVG